MHCSGFTGRKKKRWSARWEEFTIGFHVLIFPQLSERRLYGFENNVESEKWIEESEMFIVNETKS